MKTVFFIVLAVFLVDVLAISLLTSAINKLKFEISREASREKRRAFQKRKHHFDQPIAPTEIQETPVPMPAAPAPRPVDDGQIPVDFSDAPALPRLAADPLPPTGRITAPARPSFVSPASAPLSVGRIQNIGVRLSQQDAQCVIPLFQRMAVLAVVADGMGGLEDGGAISQKIVQQVNELSPVIRPEHIASALPSLLQIVNREVTLSLGSDRLYKCGSTFAAVLATQKVFHWISVGDSRIYLYRAGYLNQLNRDHNLLNDWMPDILNGARDYGQCSRDPAGRQLTSFVGMGELRYVDKNTGAIPIEPGDRILLLTDGVYNAVSPQQIATLLKQYPNVQTAAEMLERTILAAHIPGQDNFTAQIIAF